jgi:hypothetical protein
MFLNLKAIVKFDDCDSMKHDEKSKICKQGNKLAILQ